MKVNTLPFDRQKMEKYKKYKRVPQSSSVLPKAQAIQAVRYSLLPSNDTKSMVEANPASKQSNGKGTSEILRRLDTMKQKYLKKPSEGIPSKCPNIQRKKDLSPIRIASSKTIEQIIPKPINQTQISKSFIYKDSNTSKSQTVYVGKSQVHIKDTNLDLQNISNHSNPKNKNEVPSIVHQIIRKKIQQTFKSSRSSSKGSEDLSNDVEQEAHSLPTFLQDQTIPLKLSIQIAFDEQYIDTSASIDEDKATQLKVRTIEEEIHLWMHSPSTLLADAIPTIQQLMHFPQPEFVFTSTNKTYTPTIAHTLDQFVLKRNVELTQGQKKALYHIALQYFYRSANELTSEFFIILAKLGSQYLNQNALFFGQNLHKYISILLKHRSLFTTEEKTIIINFLIDQRQLSEYQMAHLLLVHPTQKLIHLLFSRHFGTRETILLLACLNFLRKQSPTLAGAYLKLIGVLSDDLPHQKQLIQSMLAHVKEVQTTERHYQMHKHIKLKLIHLLSEGLPKEEAKETADSNKSSKLIGYWSRAVDKLKIATTQLTE